MKIYDYTDKKNICGDRLREARVVRRLRQEDLAAQIQLKGINMERDSSGVPQKERYARREEELHHSFMA